MIFHVEGSGHWDTSYTPKVGKRPGGWDDNGICTSRNCPYLKIDKGVWHQLAYMAGATTAYVPTPDDVLAQFYELLSKTLNIPVPELLGP